jgi:hypothetical protein
MWVDSIIVMINYIEVLTENTFEGTSVEENGVGRNKLRFFTHMEKFR